MKDLIENNLLLPDYSRTAELCVVPISNLPSVVYRQCVPKEGKFGIVSTGLYVASCQPG
jgi:hypothetical protein